MHVSAIGSVQILARIGKDRIGKIYDWTADSQTEEKHNTNGIFDVQQRLNLILGRLIKGDTIMSGYKVLFLNILIQYYSL